MGDGFAMAEGSDPERALERVVGRLAVIDGQHVEAAALGQAHDEVQRIAASLASIKRRHEQTGRIGCSGAERADMLQLADIYEQLLVALPRRTWHDAYERAIRQPKMRVAA